ncbi:hypothetical protein [Phytopseudomonas dryadis]|uniref:Uncharacterized protein n=1 Tax=Phytopseudomonas dryadis TaxID=2487520 RepID=A0ABY1Z8P0_9GAMM|nr:MULTISPECIES: hypothetical protein [Pseudomonas]TBV06742.1 hypothetical protein DNK34_10455 [Pseudomonas dryadis]TBV18577.1 hypothetical protein DNK41_07755 [Pseudomonas sp. FRB 230]
MRLALFATAILMTTGALCHAQDSTATLREALGQLPEIVLTNPVADQAYFVDMAALWQLNPSASPAEALNRLNFGRFVAPVNVMASALPGFPEEWKEKAGIDAREIRYFAGFGQSHFAVSYWGLADEAAAGEMMTGLAGLGFVSAGDGVLGNGKPNALDPSAIDPRNPWRGAVGQASFVARQGSVLIQAPAPEAMANLLLGEGDAGAAGNIVVATALDGIDGALTDGTLIQAMLISPVLGLASIDPDRMLVPDAQNIDDMRAAIEAQMETAQKGIPPYLGGLLVDAQAGDTPALVVSLAYQDCAIADTAIAQIEARWNQTMQERNPAEISGTSVESGSGLCAATVTFIDAAPDAASPVLARRVLDAVMRREFTVLQIGETQ